MSTALERRHRHRAAQVSGDGGERVGIVFDVRRGSRHDGPGVRTAVFLKGCPLRCAWCPNPESWSAASELWFDLAACTDCGDCVAACAGGAHAVESGRHRLDRARCLVRGDCVGACRHAALRVVGRAMSVDEVIEIAERDRPLYSSCGGGLTISGGEPLAQPEFTRALLSAARRRGIHTCLDTSGDAPAEELESVLPLVDLVLFDYKATGSERHRQLTGVAGTRIRRNLVLLIAAGVPLVLRVPLVSGVNDTPEHLDAIASIAETAGVRVEVMPYRALGAKKLRLDRPDADEWPSARAAQVQVWLAALRRRGCDARLA
jgi:glycyl-radical enzyme activating protein